MFLQVILEPCLESNISFLEMQKDGVKYCPQVLFILANYYFNLRDNLFFFSVTVTGIYRATPLRVNPKMRNVKAVYKTYIDVIHFRKTDKRKLHERDSDKYVSGFEITKKNHCDGEIFEHSFRLRSLKLCSNISPSQ